MTNLLAYGGDVWLVTITAPGTPEFHRSRGVSEQWLEQWALPHGDRAAFDEWNRTAPKRWSELHRKASQQAARNGWTLNVLGYVWQLQPRGALHLHLVLGFATDYERRSAWAYVKALRERTHEHGFGYVDAVDRDGKSGRSRVMEPHRAAGYLSRYLATGEQFQAALRMKHRPSRLVYVSPRLTAITGCTMRRLRRARFLYMIRSGRSIFAHAGRLPAWLHDTAEHAAVASLLRGTVCASAP